jgi:hypothetical protein
MDWMDWNDLRTPDPVVVDLYVAAFKMGVPGAVEAYREKLNDLARFFGTSRIIEHHYAAHSARGPAHVFYRFAPAGG